MSLLEIALERIFFVFSNDHTQSFHRGASTAQSSAAAASLASLSRWPNINEVLDFVRFPTAELLNCTP